MVSCIHHTAIFWAAHGHLIYGQWNTLLADGYLPAPAVIDKERIPL